MPEAAAGSDEEHVAMLFPVVIAKPVHREAVGHDPFIDELSAVRPTASKTTDVRPKQPPAWLAAEPTATAIAR